MDENKPEQNQTEEQTKYVSLFERIKGSILKKNTQDETISSEADDTSADIIDEPVLGRGVVDVSPDSLLFSIWSEWKKNSEASDIENSEEEENEDEQELESLELVLEASGAAEIPMSDEEIEREKQRATIQLMLKAKQYQKLVKPNDEGVSPDLDAYMVIHVAQKRMAAWAFVFPPSGNGKPLRRAQVYMAMHEYSVCAGVDQDAVDYLINEQPYFKLIPIAYGTPMIPGIDGSIEEKFKRKVDKTFAVDERGDVDYRVQNYIQAIHAGDVICKSTPPTMGTDGVDVLGTTIPAKNGEPAKLLAGQNTALNEDKTQIIATMDGHIQYESGKFQVKPLFYVSGDVDFNVGNIDFLGDVHISGDVREDFVVHATGTVTVDGLVEGAVIEAGNDVFIAKGILGDEKAVIKAGGNVQTEYIENCIIYAGDTVQAGSIISSFINSDNQIIVRAGRGTIIGGKMVAANLIDAKIIGCRTERPTSLIAGELPYIQEQKEEIAQAMDKIAKEKRDIERNMGFLNRDIEEADPEKLQTAANMRLRKSVLSMQENHLRKQLTDFEDKTADIPNCRIKADVVYPITRIQIQDYSHTITEKTMSCNIHVGEDSIELI